MHERLTSRNTDNELLFAGTRVIAGEHCQAYLELEEAEDYISELGAERDEWKSGAEEAERKVEVLENAIRNGGGGDNFSCWTCKNYNCQPDFDDITCRCHGDCDWRFDFERFGKKE